MSSNSAPSPRASSPVARRDQPGRGQIISFMILGLLITAGVLFFSILQYGIVSGEEFAPENFTRRHFTYYEIPFLRIQVVPIDRRDGTNDLERYLISEKLISEVKQTDAQRRWDLVVATHGNAGQVELVFSEGEARILCAYLDALDKDRKNIWLEWSKKHPDLAKIIWPAVAKLARQELYVFIPELLLAARGSSDAVTLEQRLNSLLADKYLEFAKTQQQLGRHEAAVELFTEAIALAPQLAAAFAGRANSFQVLGKKDRATADLAQAQKFGSRR